MIIPNKVKAIQALAVPKTRKKLCQLVFMINLYGDNWQKRYELIAPLTVLTSKNAKYKWKYEQQNKFDAIKCAIGHELFLAYPEFNDPFEIHTDASKL